MNNTPSAVSVTANGQSFTIILPDAQTDAGPSVFLISLPKAGSTLLNRIMRPLCKTAGLTPFSIHNKLWEMGLNPDTVSGDIPSLFNERGYVYLGFRGWDPQYPIPACASGRTVFLMRDPRDMAVSQYFSEAFSHKPPGTGTDGKLARQFETRRQEIRQQGIDEYTLTMAPTIRTIHDRTFDKLQTVEHRVWRYEDVVFDKIRWVHEMLDYLNLDVPDQIVERVVAENDIRPDSEARDQHVRKVTPGDHRNKLRPETIAALNETFADILSHHQYDTN